MVEPTTRWRWGGGVLLIWLFLGGEWTPPSLVQFGRYIAMEIMLLGALVVCGKFVIRRI
jgi:hypothetical protein